MIDCYKKMMTFCEAVLFTKICGQFVCLAFSSISHYNTSVHDIVIVADIFLVSSVLIPLISCVVFYLKKHIAIPCTLIVLNFIIVLARVDFDCLKIVTLTF